MLQDELYTVVEIGGNTATIRLLPNSAIFKAHFPGNPITPGVCQAGIVEEVAEMMCGRKLTLREVKTLKFVEILKPVTVGDVTITFDKRDEDGDLLITKGVITADGKIYTKFSLVFEMA